MVQRRQREVSPAQQRWQQLVADVKQGDTRGWWSLHVPRPQQYWKHQLHIRRTSIEYVDKSVLKYS